MQDHPLPHESFSDEIMRLRQRLAMLEVLEADYCQTDKLLRISQGIDGEHSVSSLAERVRAALEGSRSPHQDSTNTLRAVEQASRMALLTDVSTKMNLAKTEADVFRVAAHFTPLVVPSQRASVARLTPDGITAEVFALEGQVGIVPFRNGAPPCRDSHR